MKNKVRFIVVVIFFFVIQIPITYSQNGDFRPGFIVNLKHDTIKGLVDLKGNLENAESCTFKKTDKDNPITYKPNEILAYTVIDSRVYIAKKINVAQDSIFVFLENNYNGIINLLYYRSFKDVRYFYLQKDGSLIDFLKNKISVDAEMKDSKGLLVATGKLTIKGNYICKLGIWKSFYPNGIIRRELEYYDGQNSANINYGDLINIENGYYEDGKILYTIQHPKLTDDFLKKDTLFVYYQNGSIKFKFDEKEKYKVDNMLTGKQDDYEYSGKATAYFENGSIEYFGFLSPPSRHKISKEEQNLYPCALKDLKKIGVWYYFDQAGNIKDIIIYDMCGSVKQKLNESDIKKENAKLLKKKNKYIYDFNKVDN